MRYSSPFSCVLAVALLGSLVRCASSQRDAHMPLLDPSEERLTTMRRDVDELTNRFDRVQTAIERMERKIDRAARTRQMPVTKLKHSPDDKNDEEDRDAAMPPDPWSNVGGNKGEAIVDSSQEDLANLYAGAAELRAGRTDRALSALHDFLRDHPRQAYADRAHRLVVEAHWRGKEWSLVIAEANRLATLFPGTFAAEEALSRKLAAERNLGLTPSQRTASRLN